MTTITEQLHALKEAPGDDAKAAYVKLLGTTGSDELDAEQLNEIVKVCDAAGVPLSEYERDRHIASMLYVTQDQAETESYHRVLCKRISHQIRDLRNTAPADPRMRQRHTEKIRQQLRLLSMNQVQLHKAESSRESLKAQSKRFWWFDAFTESESTP